jgi:ATP-dependent Zn protease
MHLDFLDKNKRCAYDIGLNKESIFLQKKNENIITNRFPRKTKQQERISSKKQKGTRKHKKKHASQFLIIVFLFLLLFFIFVFKFCFVLFALVLLLKNHIPRAVGLITLRQNGI